MVDSSEFDLSKQNDMSRSHTDGPVGALCAEADRAIISHLTGKVTSTKNDAHDPSLLTTEPHGFLHFPAYSVSLTDDGNRLWYITENSHLCLYDFSKQKEFTYEHPCIADYSPDGLDVSGESGEETVYVATGQDRMHGLDVNGYDVHWTSEFQTPDGDSISEFVVHPLGEAYFVTETGEAYKHTRSDGITDIGIVNTHVEFTDIFVSARSRVYLASSGGRLYRYDDSYHNWTPIGVTNGDAIVAATSFSSENYFAALDETGELHLREDKTRWQTHDFSGEGFTHMAAASDRVYLASESDIETYTVTTTPASSDSVSADSPDDSLALPPVDEFTLLCPDCEFTTGKHGYLFCPRDGRKLGTGLDCPDCEFRTTSPMYNYCPKDGSSLYVTR